MPEKKYQIFVSSTYIDLKDTRSKVIDTILNVYHFPVGMEFFSAGDAEQWEIIKELIDESDYYIVIIGHRYGSSAEDGVSYTEKEYNYAVERGIPVMAFIRNRDVATRENERDKTAANRKKLDAFLNKAQLNKMCDFWATDDELATKVAVALPKMFHRTPRTGWVRGDTAMTPEVANEIAASSRENRALRDEVSMLRRNAMAKVPKLNLSIDGSWTFKQMPYREIEKPGPLSTFDIPAHLAKYVSEADIKEYNRKIPADRELEERNHARRLSLEASKNAYLPVFTITNEGSAKARDVIATIIFPSVLGVLSKKKSEKIGEIENIIPKNPIDLAEAEYRKRTTIRSALDRYSVGVRDIGAMSSFMLPYAAEIEMNDSEVSEKIVTIRFSSLIHTQNRVIDEGIRVFPVSAGSGEVMVTMICEELASPIEFKMPVQVN